eukprot:scaffold11378_cov112-Cylindrotheca_fusiformis.AAC.3
MVIDQTAKDTASSQRVIIKAWLLYRSARMELIASTQNCVHHGILLKVLLTNTARVSNQDSELEVNQI